MKITIRRAILVLAGVALGAAQAMAQPRPVEFDDIMSLRAVGSPAIAPDGSAVLYTVRQWERAPRPAGAGAEPGRMESRTHLWRVATSGSPAARQLTFGERGESAPAWSPDGRYISFIAARGSGSGDEGPRPQVWLMRADGGEAWKLTDAKEGVGGYEWAPDSGRIAFTTRDPLPAEEEARRKRRDDPQVFESDFRHSHLWVADIERGEETQLTSGTDFTVKGAPSWAPDATRLVFTAAPTPMLRDSRDDLFVVTIASRELRRITTNPGPDRGPAWSPDGRTIAYVATEAGPVVEDGLPLQRVGNSRLMLYDVASGRVTDASSPSFDYSPSGLTWTPDGRLLFGAGQRVYREMYTYDPARQQYRRLTRERTIWFGSLSRDGRLAAFTMDSPTEPAEIYVAGPEFAEPRRLTNTNPQVGDLALGRTEVITWTSDDLEIEGVLLEPVGFVPGVRYPLLVVVHGGPTSAFTNGFRMSAGDPGQHWAGQGWAVLYPNPRGSTNYGERFMRGNIPDWGGGDYRDIMRGVDAAVARGVADPERLAVMGWSYGGYMTSWIVSQTDRFKAAMMGAGLSNIYSMYGTNDIPNYLATFFGGIPDAETIPLYLERSGLTYAGNVTTPLLILHGSNDERVPIGQPMEFYRALKDRGRTVELVFYPRAGHGLSEYYHQRDRLRRQFEWITRHTLGASGTRTTSP
jgi:dipeptidyl aminopeptidase/acylaminoacyl peptidase